MRKNYAVIAAGGLGTRLKDYKDNEFTKVLIELNGLSMISTQIKQLQLWGLENFIIITNPEFHDFIVEDVSKNYKDLKYNTRSKNRQMALRMHCHMLNKKLKTIH